MVCALALEGGAVVNLLQIFGQDSELFLIVNVYGDVTIVCSYILGGRATVAGYHVVKAPTG